MPGYNELGADMCSPVVRCYAVCWDLAVNCGRKLCLRNRGRPQQPLKCVGVGFEERRAITGCLRVVEDEKTIGYLLGRS